MNFENSIFTNTNDVKEGCFGIVNFIISFWLA